MATLSEIKQANKIYFERGKDRLHGVVKRNFRTINGQQYMIEKQIFVASDNSKHISFTVREIDKDTLQIGQPERFYNPRSIDLMYPGMNYE